MLKEQRDRKQSESSEPRVSRSPSKENSYDEGFNLSAQNEFDDPDMTMTVKL